MKRITALILLLATLISLTACGKDGDAPEGMQLVRGGESVGYNFYVPEEWVVANHGDISAAYVSTVDKTSASYVECTPPEGTVDEYFKASLSEYQTAPTLIEENKAVTFGNADEARMYVFDHENRDYKFRTMQIFAKYGERFGIFTFTSFRENMSSGEKTQYEYYQEKRQAIIENFKYVEKSGTASEPTDYETDADGYRLISDKSLAKFSLYVPEEFTVKSSSGIVEAYLPDGSNINMTTAGNTGVVVSDYWKGRKAELEKLFGEVTVIGEDMKTSLGETDRAFAYEYKFFYNGEEYHVYQVLAITTFNGYVFTYTAKEESYSSHLDTVKKIMDKVRY